MGHAWSSERACMVSLHDTARVVERARIGSLHDTESRSERAREDGPLQASSENTSMRRTEDLFVTGVEYPDASARALGVAVDDEATDDEATDDEVDCLSIITRETLFRSAVRSYIVKSSTGMSCGRRTRSVSRNSLKAARYVSLALMLSDVRSSLSCSVIESFSFILASSLGVTYAIASTAIRGAARAHKGRQAWSNTEHSDHARIKTSRRTTRQAAPWEAEAATPAKVAVNSNARGCTGKSIREQSLKAAVQAAQVEHGAKQQASRTVQAAEKTTRKQDVQAAATEWDRRKTVQEAEMEQGARESKQDVQAAEPSTRRADAASGRDGCEEAAERVRSGDGAKAGTAAKPSRAEPGESPMQFRIRNGSMPD